MHASVRTALVVLSSILAAVSCADPTAPPVDPVSIQTASLAEALEGQGYSQRLDATGGRGGYSWVLAAGSLPSGLTLSPTGIISGTPVGTGTSSFRVRATDSGGQSATADLSIPVVQALAVHTWTLPDAEVGEACPRCPAPSAPHGAAGPPPDNPPPSAAGRLPPALSVLTRPDPGSIMVMQQ